MGQLKNTLTDLINTGADASGHLFDIYISGLSGTDGFSTTDRKLYIRAQSVEVPDVQVPTVSYELFNQRYDLLSNGNSLERKLRIVFRIDDNYDVYKNFLDVLPFSDDNGTISEKFNNTYTIDVEAMKVLPKNDLLDGNELETEFKWQFFGAKPYHATGFSYSRTASELTSTIEFIFKTLDRTKTKEVKKSADF